MAPSIPTTVPTEFESGATVVFTTAPSEYPSEESWTVEWVIAGDSKVSVTAVTDGSGYKVTLAAASNTLTPGTYRWTLYATKASERYAIDTGILTVRQAPKDAPAGALQSQDEQELLVLNAAIKARLTAGGDVQSYTIGDRSLEKVPLKDLLAWRTQVRARIAAQRRGSPFQTYKVRFPGVSA